MHLSDSSGLSLRNQGQRSVLLHLRLDLLEQSLELVHVRLLLWPADAQPLLLVGLGDLVMTEWSGSEVV